MDALAAMAVSSHKSIEVFTRDDTSLPKTSRRRFANWAPIWTPTLQMDTHPRNNMGCSTKSHLFVEELSIHFGGLRAVDGVTFAIEPGRIHGLIGPNGAGKTTIFNCVTGFYHPTQGHIHFQDRLITHLRPDQIARLGIARTFQNVQLFRGMSVLDNILVAMHIHMRTGLLAEALSLPLAHRQERLMREQALEIMDFLGLAALQRQAAGNLPLGLQKSLELARALGLAPKLLLLDEPAAGLNASETQELAQLLRSIRDRFKLTILLVEHDMSLVMSICETITVLNFGQKIAEGTPFEVQHNPEVLKAYLGETVGAEQP
jgi:branched-chain amino acid transport system ATP-binding protein